MFVLLVIVVFVVSQAEREPVPQFGRDRGQQVKFSLAPISGPV